MRTVRTGPLIGLIAAGALLTGLAGTAGLGATGWLVGVACGLTTNATLAHALTRSGAARLGLANWVTLTRATLVGGVAALIADAFGRTAPVATLVTLTAVALALDAVDGRVARRTQTATTLGARFDLEVDAFLIFILSVYLASSIGLWVLVIGAARYAFLAARWRLPWLREPSPPRYWCKVVAAIQGIALTVGVAGVLPESVASAAIAVALALLVESFGRETWWLWRYRKVPPNPRDARAVVMAESG